jgi:hypothetical protein
MPLWNAFSFLLLLGLVALGSGLFLVPAWRVHRWRRRGGSPPGLIGRCLYAVPALTVAWLGLRQPAILQEAGIDLSPAKYALALIFALYLGASYLRRALEDAHQSTVTWVLRWPGWPRRSGPEPSTDSGSGEMFRFAALPTIAALTSLTDVITKASNLFPNSPAVLLTQYVFLVGAVGAAVHCLTSTTEEQSVVGITTIVPRYQRSTRIAAIVGACLAVLIWAMAAAYEPPGTLTIVAEELPLPHERSLEVVIANQTDVVHVLSSFHVAAKTPIPFQCLSAQFDIPELGDYVLKFHVAKPLTKITAEPLRQLPPQTSGRLRIALEPDATGACADHWTARIRVFVVSDDGSRSGTHWFQLEDRTNNDFPQR